jgi:glycosyltransferase involved in cell wall biosynthesis
MERSNRKFRDKRTRPIRQKPAKDEGKIDTNLKSDSSHPHQKRNRPYISVVVPLLNEAESLPELAKELEYNLNGITNGNYEVIFVDDGSTDDSFEVIRTINRKNKRFKAIRFRRNYGKSAALAVGFNTAQGSFVATMDADLQDDPKELSPMLHRLKEGFDMVSGWKKERKDPISKTIPSKFFNWVTSKVSKVKLHDFNCGLKMYRWEVTKTLDIYGEMHRYIPALAHWEGFKVTEIVVNHRERKYGKTKFGLSRFVNGFLDLMTVMLTTKYFKRPLHFFGTIGTILTLIGFAISLTLSIQWFIGDTFLSNRPLVLFGLGLIIVGVQFISTGLLGEMIVKNSIKDNVSNYSIKERL